MVYQAVYTDRWRTGKNYPDKSENGYENNPSGQVDFPNQRLVKPQEMQEYCDSSRQEKNCERKKKTMRQIQDGCSSSDDKNSERESTAAHFVEPVAPQ